jgi:hypothetical protein
MSYLDIQDGADCRMRGLLSNARFEKKHKVYAERGGVYSETLQGNEADRKRDTNTVISSDQRPEQKSFS